MFMIPLSLAGLGIGCVMVSFAIFAKMAKNFSLFPPSSPRWQKGGTGENYGEKILAILATFAMVKFDNF
jgi:hypothetical protein